MSSPRARPPGEGRFHRRGFFTEGLRGLLKPLADIVEKGLERVDPGLTPGGDHHHPRPRPGPTSAPLEARPEPEPRTRLRPPGALPEEEFLRTCTTSGRCVEACPVAAIKPAWSDDPLRDRKPIVEARLQACVVCDDLSCMRACPSGALRVLPREEIRMGTAVVDPAKCLRSQGEDCQICVDKCPLGARAIEIPSFGEAVLVHAQGCVGCGVCEMWCPTDPAAIVVRLPG